MNSKQEKIFEVINALLQIKKFPEYFQDHTIRYGFLNYVAKYSLAADKYLITERALDHLTQNNFLKNGTLRRGIKSKKNGFTYEHPVPSNIIGSEILKHRKDNETVKKILNWTDLITILTTEEDNALSNAGLIKNMPEGWRFFKDDPFERYKKVGLEDGENLSRIDVYGPLKR